MMMDHLPPQDLTLVANHRDSKAERHFRQAARFRFGQQIALGIRFSQWLDSQSREPKPNGFARVSVLVLRIKTPRPMASADFVTNRPRRHQWLPRFRIATEKTVQRDARGVDCHAARILEIGSHLVDQQRDWESGSSPIGEADSISRTADQTTLSSPAIIMAVRTAEATSSISVKQSVDFCGAWSFDRLHHVDGCQRQQRAFGVHFHHFQANHLHWDLGRCGHSDNVGSPKPSRSSGDQAAADGRNSFSVPDISFNNWSATATAASLGIRQVVVVDGALKTTTAMRRRRLPSGSVRRRLRAT